MSQTIHCTNCGVALNLPEGAAGRRLKCPKCGTKFFAGANPKTGPNAPPIGGPDSSLELQRRGTSQDLPLPLAPGDLRDTFGLPMMTDSADPSPGRASASGAAGRNADATTLFDDRPVAPRRKSAAEARAQARRCPTCGSVVGVGMSVCQKCGLDLETGIRIDLEEDLAPPPPLRQEVLPIPILVVGGLCAAVSSGLAVASFVGWMNGREGFQYFIPIALFGLYGSVQFLRKKSIKLLLIALTIGAVVDVAGLIGLPIYNANAETTLIQRSVVPDDPDLAAEMILPLSERIDQQKITMGIAILFCYAVVSIYLLSPSVQKEFRK